MLTKNELQLLLKEGAGTGADFVEIFLEDKLVKSIRVMSGEVSEAGTSNVYGAGIRLLNGLDEVYGYTNNVDYESLRSLICDLRTSFTGSSGQVVPLGEAKPYKVVAKKRPNDVKTSQKAKVLVELCNIIKNHDPRIVQSIVTLVEEEQKVLVCNSHGIYQDDVRIRTRVGLLAVAQDEHSMQDAFEGPGAGIGYEFLSKLNFKEIAKNVAVSAVSALSAKEIVSEEMPVILHNGFGGVIFHEACGHPLEASAISKGLSPFTGKVGEKVASDIVTAYDDGTLEGEWGSVHFDDEGNKSEKNLLIENGILKGYMVDYKNGRRMNANPTGSSRRQSYKYSPTSRMTTTYIATGKDKFEDIIKDTKYGLFAKKLGGGSVNPASGEFNFVVSEGYMVRNGAIAEQVRGAMLIGNGSNVLTFVDKVSDNLMFSAGMCGASSGQVPVNVGQPTIRLSKITVGGGGKNE